MNTLDRKGHPGTAGLPASDADCTVVRPALHDMMQPRSEVVAYGLVVA